MTTKHKLTLEAFLKQRETKPYREYCGGEVTQKSMPTGPHSMVQRLLVIVFWRFLQDRSIGFFGPELRCIMRRDGRPWAPVPDFVFVSNERPGGGMPTGPLLVPPDLAVEILSPDDREFEAVAKVLAYVANGVRLAWLIDPVQRTVLVVSGPDQQRLLRDDDVLDGGDVLPDFRVAVRDVLPPAQG